MQENENNQDVINGMEKLSGTVEGCIYSNEENGYGIFDFSLASGDILTIVGTLPFVSEGDMLDVWGRWTHNPKYGRQFKVEQYQKNYPADAASILRYLAGGAIKGVGVKTAQRIVEEFGAEAFDIIENHPDWLTQVHGISLKRAYEISEDFKAKSGMRNAMIFFKDHFGAATIVKIYHKWGVGCVEKAKNNPYALCESIEGIGFEKADTFARSLGISEDSQERLMSGILHVLRHNENQNGHTCLPHEKLVAAAAQMLGADAEKIKNGVDLLVEYRKCVCVKYDETLYVYTAASYECECFIAKKLEFIDKTCINADIREINRFIDREESENGITYATLQKKAIIDAMSNGVMILTGGPGTGKTTIVRALLKIFNSMGFKAALAAPTGRAAKRLSISTSTEAKTIHRLLEFNHEIEGDSVFLRNENHYLDENVIIIDEASMADSALMCALLKAIKPGAKLIIIGDADQLPSVGAGNVLRDIISSERFATVELREIFRQAQSSLIVTNAHKINNGDEPILNVTDNDFFFIRRDTDRQIALTVADLCKNRLPKAYGDETVGNIQVISPSRLGEGGTNNLNILLQQMLNPKASGKTEFINRERTFRKGDKVMQIRNNYEIEWDRDGNKGMGIFNGDIGEIIYIDLKDKYMEIDFDERAVRYDFSMLEDLEHAYAITVHKSQGSEYPIVIIPTFSAAPMLLTRNMLYTAVTRAQKMVILVGKPEIISTMVSNNRQTMRYTGLERILRTQNSNEK